MGEGIFTPRGRGQKESHQVISHNDFRVIAVISHIVHVIPLLTTKLALLTLGAMPPFRFNMPNPSQGQPQVPSAASFGGPPEADLSGFDPGITPDFASGPLSRGDKSSPKVPFPPGAASAWASGASQGGFGGFQAPSTGSVPMGMPEMPPMGDEMSTQDSMAPQMGMPPEVVPPMGPEDDDFAINNGGSMMGPPDMNQFGGNERSMLDEEELAMAPKAGKPKVPRY